METNILELFTGLMGGSLGALALQAAGKAIVSQIAKIRRARKKENSSLTLNSTPFRFDLPQDSSTLVSTPTANLATILQERPPPIFSTCPSCGLEASSSLLEEHLETSPSHRKKQVQERTAKNPATVVSGKTTNLGGEVEESFSDFLNGRYLSHTGRTSVRKHSRDDDQRVLRTLLQLLVPPRAFGLRTRDRERRALVSVAPSA